ncbi:MAG: ribosome silencing factor [Bacteriovorax sp. MedPE-SWde]|nr:MAG: ribosome silencing factor [Bacteriovorax sp. MedPE-SWde]
MSSSEYILSNVDEIINKKELEFPLNMAMAGTWILGNFKALNLKVIDMKDSTSLADYFVLASASNMTQAQAMASELSKQMNRLGYEVLSKEGYNSNSDWILIDIGDVIVHIFQETSRDVYDLDNLWNSPSIQIPNEYYYSSDNAENDAPEDKGFF